MVCRKFEIETYLHNTDVFVVDSRGGEYGKFVGACVATLKTTGSTSYMLYTSSTLQLHKKKKILTSHKIHKIVSKTVVKIEY